MSHDNIEKFRFFDACYAIKRTSSQLNYVELYKRSFDLMSTSFNECTTRRKTSIFNFELIFFLNDLKNATRSVFFDDENDWILLKKYWDVEMFLLNDWVIESFLLSCNENWNFEKFLLSCNDIELFLVND